MSHARALVFSFYFSILLIASACDAGTSPKVEEAWRVQVPLSAVATAAEIEAVSAVLFVRAHALGSRGGKPVVAYEGDGVFSLRILAKPEHSTATAAALSAPGLFIIGLGKDSGANQCAETTPLIGSRDVESAELAVQNSGIPSVNVLFKPEAGERIHADSSNQIGKRLLVCLDDVLLMNPTLAGPIGPRTQITGDFDTAEALGISAILSGGPLPNGTSASLQILP